MLHLVFFLAFPVELLAETRTVTMCVMAERGSDDLFHNYDRSAAAVEMAVQYANENILAEQSFNLTQLDINIGSTCPVRSKIGSYVMDLVMRGINCDVFIGPGM